MKNLLIALLLTASTHCAKAQRVQEYTASNGITYKVGDLIELGQGSMPNGDFRWLRISGWGAIMDDGTTDGLNGHKDYAGTKATIKKIKIVKSKKREWEKVWLLVGVGNITPYSIELVSAIKDCEVVPCKDIKTASIIAPSEADELKKFKELYDQGVITEEEYNKQKQKILSR